MFQVFCTLRSSRKMVSHETFCSKLFFKFSNKETQTGRVLRKCGYLYSFVLGKKRKRPPPTHNTALWQRPLLLEATKTLPCTVKADLGGDIQMTNGHRPTHHQSPWQIELAAMRLWLQNPWKGKKLETYSYATEQPHT